MNEPNDALPAAAPPVDAPLPVDAPPPVDAPVAPPPPPPVALAVVEGDRLGVPVGATRKIWEPGGHRPSYVFLVIVSVISFALDIGSKLWAEKNLPVGKVIDVFSMNGWDDKTAQPAWDLHFNFQLAENKGGAWGLLQGTPENVRRPFFLLVSIAAIAFIVTLYRRLQPKQRALKWGLPLVLGGALGNVFDRIRYGWVIDFIRIFYNSYPDKDVGGVVTSRVLTGHDWPTFNVADIAICVGVGLMAIDMFTSKRKSGVTTFSPPIPPAQAGEVAATFAGVPTSASVSAVLEPKSFPAPAPLLSEAAAAPEPDAPPPPDATSGPKAG